MSSDVLMAAENLAQMIKKDPEALETEAWSRGDNFLEITHDPSFGIKTIGLTEQKIKIIKQAIEDLSGRGRVLSAAFIGLIFFENEIQTFISQYGESPTGKIVFKIGIKDVDDFKEWRNGDLGKVSEDDINAGIYRLAAFWAELL